MAAPLRAKAPAKATAASQPARGSSKTRPTVVYFREYKRASLKRRAEIERAGIPYEVVEDLGERLGVSAGDFQSYLGVPKATYSKKKRNNEPFTGAVGHAALGLLELAAMVRGVLAVAGTGDAKEFDVEAWLGEWLQKPQPALDGSTPGELIDTPSGRAEVKRLLGAAFSGAAV